MLKQIKYVYITIKITRDYILNSLNEIYNIVWLNCNFEIIHKKFQDKLITECKLEIHKKIGKTVIKYAFDSKSV